HCSRSGRALPSTSPGHPECPGQPGSGKRLIAVALHRLRLALYDCSPAQAPLRRRIVRVLNIEFVVQQMDTRAREIYIGALGTFATSPPPDPRLLSSAISTMAITR